MNLKLASLIASGSLLAAGSGYFAAVALSQSPGEPQRTVTIDVATGPQGDQGHRASKVLRGRRESRASPARRGLPGDFSCIEGFAPGILVINHPGGQVPIYTCLDRGGAMRTRSH